MSIGDESTHDDAPRDGPAVLPADALPALHIRSPSPIPRFLQLKSQLEYLIVTGALPPGAKLPSIREVARMLGVGPATVVRAYGELVEAGIAVSNGGVGFFVIGADSGQQGPHGAFRERVAALVRDATESGISLEQLVEIFMAQVADTRMRLAHRAVIVLSKRDGGIEELAMRLRHALADMGVEVVGRAIEDLAEAPGEHLDELRRAAAVVSLLFDVKQARELLGPHGIEVMPMLSVVRDDVRERVVHLPAETRTGVVASSAQFIDGMITAISHLNPNLTLVRSAELGGRRSLKRLFDCVDCVIYGTLTRSVVNAQLPASVEGIEFVYIPDDSSVQRLRLRLHEDALR